MTEETIHSKLRSSRSHVQTGIGNSERCEFGSHVANILLTAIAAVTAFSLGVGGKPVAEQIGGIVANQGGDDLEAKTMEATAGWRFACIAVAVAAVLANYAGRQQNKHAKSLERARALNAALKVLVIDLEDNGRDSKEVTREYQRLTEAYPEFAD